ncbi:MAG: carbon storage regulator CsrA [Fibrobacterota bacterium]|jgi:carbon storage regulator
MLVLSRKAGESIHIGEGIVITVLESDARGARIGITAPQSVPVYRSEVYERIQDENRKALVSTGERNLGDIAGFFRQARPTQD